MKTNDVSNVVIDDNELTSTILQPPVKQDSSGSDFGAIEQTVRTLKAMEQDGIDLANVTRVDVQDYARAVMGYDLNVNTVWTHLYCRQRWSSVRSPRKTDRIK